MGAGQLALPGSGWRQWWRGRANAAAGGWRAAPVGVRVWIALQLGEARWMPLGKHAGSAPRPQGPAASPPLCTPASPTRQEMPACMAGPGRVPRVRGVAAAAVSQMCCGHIWAWQVQLRIHPPQRAGHWSPGTCSTLGRAMIVAASWPQLGGGATVVVAKTTPRAVAVLPSSLRCVLPLHPRSGRTAQLFPLAQMHGRGGNVTANMPRDKRRGPVRIR